MRPLTLPQPPRDLLEELAGPRFEPAPELREWVQRAYLAVDGPLYNPDHQHLQEAHLGFLWTNVTNTKSGVMVAGTCEIPKPLNGNKWQKARVLYQLEEWFGAVPDFLITLDAVYWANAPVPNACALIDHEVYHAGQATDMFGMPRFHKDTGQPIYMLNPHDAEEFVGVVRRWGVGASARGVAKLVEAANRPPEIAEARMQAACGTCGRITV